MKLNQYIYKIDRPVLFKNILKADEKSNCCLKWTPETLAEFLNEKNLEFRIGKADFSKDESNLSFFA